MDMINTPLPNWREILKIIKKKKNKPDESLQVLDLHSTAVTIFTNTSYIPMVYFKC